MVDHRQLPVCRAHVGPVELEIALEPSDVDRGRAGLAAEIVRLEPAIRVGRHPAVTAGYVEHIGRAAAGHRLDDHTPLAEHDVCVVEDAVRLEDMIASLHPDVDGLEARLGACVFDHQTVDLDSDGHRGPKPGRISQMNGFR